MWRSQKVHAKTDRRPLRPDELVTFTWTRALDLQTAAHALRYATPLGSVHGHRVRP